MKDWRIFAIALVATTAAIGTAQAITDTFFLYSSPRTGYFTISPAALSPDGDGADYIIGFTGGARLQSDSTRCFVTGVNLPQGARITQMRVFYSSGASNPHVRLYREALATGVAEQIANINLPITGGARSAANVPIAASLATVGNAGFSYGFGTCLFDTASRLHGVRITYTYTNAGD